MEEYQKHVLDILNPAAKTTFCGAAIQPFEWHFASAQHAFSATASGSRLVPCPNCVSAMFKKLDGESYVELAPCWR